MSASYFPPIISSIYLEELAGQATAAKDSALVALNAAEAARDTALEYRNDAQTYYTQVQQIQEGDYVTNLSLEERLGAFNFADLQGIPATFTPSVHGHAWSEITNKPTMYPPTAHGHAWSEITGKPSEYEPAPHIHTWQQIAQKPGTFPPETHFHSWNEIENKPNVFNPAAHTHSWGDISGKPTKFEPADHVHTWDMLENKPLTFPPQSHHHHWSQVTSKPEQATRWPHFSEVTNKPAQATRWPAFSEVTGKPAQATRWPTFDEVTAKPNFGEGAYSSVKAEEHGLGAIAVENFTNFDDLNVCAFIAANDGVANAPPWLDSRVMPGLHSDKGGRSLTIIPSRSGRLGYRVQFDGVFRDWTEFFTSANLNFNEFGGNSGEMLLLDGIANTGNTALFYIEGFEADKYSSLSLTLGGATVADSFSVVDKRTGIVIGNPTSFNFLGAASNRALFIRANGMSGLTVDRPCRLQVNAGYSAITFNK